MTFTILSIFVIAFTILCACIGVVPAVIVCAIALCGCMALAGFIWCWLASALESVRHSNGLVP